MVQTDQLKENIKSNVTGRKDRLRKSWRMTSSTSSEMRPSLHSTASVLLGDQYLCDAPMNKYYLQLTTRVAALKN